MEAYADITPEALKARLEAGEPLELLDVREPWEHAICALPRARLIPMDELPNTGATGRDERRPGCAP